MCRDWRPVPEGGKPDNREMSWCGESVYGVWVFQSAEHAAAERERGGRLLVCPACINAMAKAMGDK